MTRIGHHGHLAADGLDHIVGHQPNLVGIGLGEQYGEFVPADSSDDIGLAKALAEQSGHALQDVIPRPVPERVVHVLEVVEVDEHHRPGGFVSRRSFGLAGQFLLEMAAVEEPGEEVVVDDVFQVLRHFLALGDVLHLRDHVERCAVGIADERIRHQHPDVVAPGVAVAHLDLEAGDLAGDELRQAFLVEGDVVRVRDGVQRRGFELVDGMPGDPAERCIDLQPAAVHGDERHADGCVVERGLEALVDLAESALHAVRLLAESLALEDLTLEASGGRCPR